MCKTKVTMEIDFLKLFCTLLFIACLVTAQQTETNNQTTTEVSVVTPVNNVTQTKTNKTVVTEKIVLRVNTATQPSAITRIYHMVLGAIRQIFRLILNAPKVSSVMRNIATCVVNGAVELISYYFPAPLIPVIAAVAGMMIPFEPVLMLRDKLPVTSYRRAFLTALNSFLGTFDKYRLEENYEFDPYMTQRFRRRMMNYGSKEKERK